MKRYSIGFDIGGTNIAAAMYDEKYDEVSRLSVPFPKDSDVYAVSKLLSTMKDSLAAEVDKKEIKGVGIAVPGSIDSKGEIVIDAHNLGFFDAPLLKAAKECMSGIEVAMLNDANAATLAEFNKGVLFGCDTGALLTLGTGVGGGLILNGRLFNGGRGSGVEMGHMIIAQDGEKCTCGNSGCAEALCSATWLISQGRRNFEGMIKEAADGNEENVSAKTVIDCAKAGDKTAAAIFEKYVDSLGSLVASIINLTDAQVIAVGGGVSGAGEFLFEPLRENVHKKCFFRTHGDILPAKLGNDAGMLGAALYI